MHISSLDDGPMPLVYQADLRRSVDVRYESYWLRKSKQKYDNENVKTTPHGERNEVKSDI